MATSRRSRHNVGTATRHGKGSNLTYSSAISLVWRYRQVGAWLRLCHARGGARSTVSRAAGQRHDRPGQAAAKPPLAGFCAASSAAFSASSLASSTGPSSPSRSTARPSRRSAISAGNRAIGGRVDGDGARRPARAGDSSATARSTTASIAASARLSRRASSASRRRRGPRARAPASGRATAPG